MDEQIPVPKGFVLLHMENGEAMLERRKNIERVYSLSSGCAMIINGKQYNFRESLLEAAHAMGETEDGDE